MDSEPYYNFEEFIDACNSNPKKIILWENVRETASKQFNLHTKNQILAFIAKDGLEDLKFIESGNFKKGKKTTPIIIDSYEFNSGNLNGYIAFFKTLDGKRWVLKSLHFSYKMKFKEIGKSPEMLKTLKSLKLTKRDFQK